MGEDKTFYGPESWVKAVRELANSYKTHVEFDASEEAMIREMAHKIGYPKEDVVRMAVRDMYMRCCVVR